MEYIVMTLSRPEATKPPVNEQEKGGANQNTSKGLRCKKVKRKWLTFALRAVVTTALFTLLARSISWSTLALALPRVHCAELLLALAAALVCTVFSSYVWHSLLLAERIHMDLARLINRS